MKKIFVFVFVMFLLVACNKAQSEPVNVPTSVSEPTTMPTTVPTVSPTKVVETEKMGIWTSQGFGKMPWAIEVVGKDPACTSELRMDPTACVGLYKLTPKVDVVVIRDGSYFSSIVEGQTETVDFSSGSFDIYAYDGHGHAFGSSWKASWFMFEKSTKVLLLDPSSYDVFISLADGRIYQMDKDAKIFSLDRTPTKYPAYGYLKCGFENDIQYCKFELP